MTGCRSINARDIPCFDLSGFEGRFVCTGLFYNGKKWCMWVRTADGLRMYDDIVEPNEMFYFAAVEALPHDIYFHFLDFIAQRLSFHWIEKPFLGLQDDFFNLSASVSKIALLHSSKDAIGTGVWRMVITEIEYIVSVCRSVYDLLHEIICFIWESIQISNSSTKKPLNKKLTRTVLFKGCVCRSEQLAERFGLIPELADFYVRNACFFLALRSFRDKIIHFGLVIPPIYSDDNGFLIQDSWPVFSNRKIWRESERQENNLVPLMPAVGMMIHNTIMACEDFSRTIEKLSVDFPPPIAPGNRFFMRGYFNELFAAVIHDADTRYIEFHDA